MTLTCWCDSAATTGRTSAFLMLNNDRAFRFSSWFLGTFTSIIWFTILISSPSTLKVNHIYSFLHYTNCVSPVTWKIFSFFTRRMWVFFPSSCCLDIIHSEQNFSFSYGGVRHGTLLVIVLQSKSPYPWTVKVDLLQVSGLYNSLNKIISVFRT
jgi:hypothetical protein